MIFIDMNIIGARRRMTSSSIGNKHLFFVSQIHSECKINFKVVFRETIEATRPTWDHISSG